jgi:hypothetical protein
MVESVFFYIIHRRVHGQKKIQGGRELLADTQDGKQVNKNLQNGKGDHELLADT